MAYEYLNSLHVDADVKKKLRNLGATTAQALLSRLEYSPGKSRSYLGSSTYQQVLDDLSPYRITITNRTRQNYSRGIRFESQVPAKIRVKERQGLFRRVNLLSRHKSVLSPSERVYLKLLENKLRSAAQTQKTAV